MYNVSMRIQVTKRANVPKPIEFPSLRIATEDMSSCERVDIEEHNSAVNALMERDKRLKGKNKTQFVLELVKLSGW